MSPKAFDTLCASKIFEPIYDDFTFRLTFLSRRYGTKTGANIVYEKLQETFRFAGVDNYYIATMKAEPTLEQVIASIKQKAACKKIILRPLMVVAGDHANNEMAGNTGNSWKKILEKEGYEVECLLEGLGQNPAIQELYVKHAQAAVERLRAQEV